MRRRDRRGSSSGTAARVAAGAVALIAAGVLTATFVSSGGESTADAATNSAQYVAIERVRPAGGQPRTSASGSAGRFRVDCGTNGNRKFSPDNPVAQPGIRNGAEHVHDFVGNLAITANSSNADLDASGTTCRNGDKSSYFWPVVRIDRSVRDAGAVQQALAATSPTVACPSVRDRLPAVPAGARAAVDRQLAELDRQEVAAGRRLLASRGVSVDLNKAVLESLRSRRAAGLTAIGDAIRAGGGRPAPMISLADCDVSYDGIHAALHGHRSAAVGVGVGVGVGAGAGAGAGSVATPTVRCPSVRGRLPGVPATALQEVDRRLDDLDRQISEANQRLLSSRGRGARGLSGDAVLGRLRNERTATLDRIAAASVVAGRTGSPPGGLARLAGCELDPGGAAPASPPSSVPSSAPALVPSSAPAPVPGSSALPDPQGPNLELPNNTGGIVRPAKVRIEYRGNAATKVVPMPKFLRALTGDAKPTSRGPANARAAWTCSGFGDRLTDRYPICPGGSRVQRVHDFPGCWDGRNLDSANHRSHVAFAERNTGACPPGFVAIPQLRITISYDIPRDVQLAGQYALDSFPEENHNPFSDHDDFINVNSARTMQRIATCINRGKDCE